MTPDVKICRNGKTHSQFLSTAKMGRRSIEMFRFPFTNLDFSSLSAQHGVPVATMLFKLNRVKGIESVFVQPHEVSVNMYEAFGWDRKIDDIVTEAFRQSAVMETRNARTKLSIKTSHWDRMREYHLDVNISKSGSCNFSRPIKGADLDALLGMGSHGLTIVSSIMTIPGVTKIYASPYKLSIEIAELFDWDKVEPFVIEMLSLELGELQISK